MEKAYYPKINIITTIYQKDRGGAGTVPRGTVCAVLGVASHNGELEMASHVGRFSVSEEVFNKWFLPIK